jgi:hypothetical protein
MYLKAGKYQALGIDLQTIFNNFVLLLLFSYICFKDGLSGRRCFKLVK